MLINFSANDLTQYARSKKRTERIFRYIIITYLLLWCVASVILLSEYSNERIAMVFLLLMPTAIGVPIYFEYYFPFFRSAKWLHNKGSDIEKEIQSGKAVISLNPYAVVPFSQIAWIFLDPIHGKDRTPIYHVLNIYCKDGVLFKINNHSEEWYELLNSELPEVISGKGPVKRKLYLQMNPDARIKRNRTKTVWGIILLLIMAAFASMYLFITKSIKPMGVVLLIALFVGGVFLLQQGRKNK